MSNNPNYEFSLMKDQSSLNSIVEKIEGYSSLTYNFNFNSNKNEEINLIIKIHN